VKQEIDNILATNLIFPIEESYWIIPIVIQDKKRGEGIHIYEDFRALDIAFVYDPFLGPFNDEENDHIVGNESYYFTDGF
jgi:hypothetical protein